jgi:hypothetical protein
MKKKEQENLTLGVLMNAEKIIREMILDKTKDGIITKHKIAVLSGIHPGQINAFMNGTRGLNSLTIQKIAEGLTKLD